MASSIQVRGDNSAVLRVTHSNIKTFSDDIRFSLQLTVEGVKEKLWKKCGTSVNSMQLELYDDARNKIADLSDNSKPLGFYSPLDGFRLHVVDLDPTSISSGGWLEDTSLVEKYKISEEAYNKRQDTFRKYKEKFTSQIPPTVEAKIPDTCMEDLSANIKVGSRCEVEPGAKRGVVKFVGRAESLGAGFWVGVQYDEPLGKHDGMVKGVRYFECPPSHGGMVRPEKVKVCLEPHYSNPLNIGIFSIVRLFVVLLFLMKEN
ncbi:Tubulin-folding cofactor B [Spatholobus suberectus]|nr:Tubulin-folding cofactor B [Spatholobus suberectus]